MTSSGSPFRKITYTLPNGTDYEQEFTSELFQLLDEVPNAQEAPQSVTITATQPANTLPTTIIRTGDVPYPGINFDEDGPCLTVGNLHIGDIETTASRQVLWQPDRVRQRQDALGEYTELEIGGQTIHRLPITALRKRLQGHIVRLDHTGVNIPSAMVPHDRWLGFINQISQRSALYHYPTGEEWPFILPATGQEHDADIDDFPIGREPKFESVYDRDSPVPAIQINIDTNLSRAQVEELFPEPYGVSYEEVAEFFRTVYVHHEWQGLNIRFDLGYKNNEPNEWDTGEWLVKSGGRWH